MADCAGNESPEADENGAERMHTSRAALNRLLDEEDTSLTLTTLASALAALGKRMEFRLAAA